MKIGILSFHASHNFGSMLQNYALQQFLIAKGHVVETINLRNEKQKYMYHHPLHKGRRNPTLFYQLARYADPKWLVSECKRWNIFESFLHDKIILSKEYNNWDSIKKDLVPSKYDAIIVGGDQIWNISCYDFDWSYYLPDNIKPIIKIAYGPSFGNSVKNIQKDDNQVTKIKQYLDDFNFISVRESDASNYLQKLLKKSIPVVADPTLLVDPCVFQKLIKEPIIKEPYIYYYTPPHTADYEAENLAITLANQLGIKIVTSYPRFFKKNQMQSVVSGPIEFLNLVKNAKIIVGKSFHLIIFSLIFHRDFITLKRKKEARINSFLNILNIAGRNMESIDDYQHLKEINYKNVDERLLHFKNESTQFLEEALKC